MIILEVMSFRNAESVSRFHKRLHCIRLYNKSKDLTCITDLFYNITFNYFFINKTNGFVLRNHLTPKCHYYAFKTQRVRSYIKTYMLIIIMLRICY